MHVRVDDMRIVSQVEAEDATGGDVSVVVDWSRSQQTFRLRILDTAEGETLAGLYLEAGQLQEVGVALRDMGKAAETLGALLGGPQK